MELSPIEKLWPSVPADLKYVEFRVPGTFRELAANREYTNEEIGRIVRCIALNTDFFVTQHIEPEVFYYRGYQNRKNQVRLRVEACRKRRKTMKEKGVDASSEGVTNGVTVTNAENSAKSDPIALSSSEKTPNILKEKTPPIVPLTKKAPSSLEKIPSCVKPKERKKSQEEVARERLQGDLFSLVAGDGVVGSQESRTGGPVALPGAADGGITVQDVASASDGVFDGVPVVDSRDDAAWIPAKFEVFWAKYPRKLAKKDAQKAFTKVIKSQKDVEAFMRTLLASLDWWKEQSTWKKDKGAYIPYPATWLNRGSWEDAVENGGSDRAEFLGGGSETDDELIRRMEGGS